MAKKDKFKRNEEITFTKTRSLDKMQK